VGDPVRLWCDDLDEAVGALQALGVRLDVIQPADSPTVAELSGGGRRFRLERRRDASAPNTGRAGMVYRDLLPGRGGGRFIASHSTIRDGGTVPARWPAAGHGHEGGQGQKRHDRQRDRQMAGKAPHAAASRMTRSPG
jgi:hypothetical protein